MPYAPALAEPPDRPVFWLAQDPEGRQQLVRECWLRGDLRYKLRPNGQDRIYQAIEEIQGRGRSAEPIVLNTHRRFGKTYLALLRLVERAIRRPGQFQKYGGPTAKQCLTMAVPNLSLILRDCPEDLRPERSGFEYRFRNPLWPAGAQESLLWLVGVNEDQGDSMRGQACDSAALDECRDMRNFEYVVRHVLSFQFYGREDPELLLLSTPPRSSAHDFSRIFVPEARRERRYLIMPSYNNEDWTEEDESVVLKIAGSKDSIAWRREAQCELVTDEEEMVIPEFLQVEDEVVVDAYERPPFFRPHICLDTGWLDWNAVLLGYVDFRHQRLIVEDEIVARYQSTGQIAEKIRQKEEALYRDYRPIRRIGDLKEQDLHDLRTDERILVQPAEKWGREVAIAALRTTFVERRIRIHSRCENLIFQLQNGVWNKQRTEFERSKAMGHLDALAALIYLHRQALWDTNPYPPEYLIPQPNTFHAKPRPLPNPLAQYEAVRSLK